MKTSLIVYHTMPTFNDPEKESFFENIAGKGENAGNQHFLLLLQCFTPFPKTNFNFLVTFIVLSANALNLDQSKILSFDKVLSLGINPVAMTIINPRKENWPGGGSNQQQPCS